MSDKQKNIMIGLFVVIAILSTVYSILFLKPRIGDGKKILRVRFSNIAGINVGTRVTVAGKPVGEVIAIEEIKDAREEPVDDLGRVYFYQLTLRVDSKVDVYNSDEIAIATTGLLGEKSIVIVPKAPIKGVVPKLINDQIIYAQAVEPLDSIIHQITTLGEKLQTAIEDFDEWFVENQDDLSQSVKSFAHSLSNIEKITKDITERKGSLGKFILNDDLYLRVVSIMGKADTLMNDINHYGILFQYDKHWQSIRTKRANMLEKLKTPAEFRNYFECEVSTITTSLGRISKLLEKSKEPEEKERILNSAPFQKDFADLLRQVEHLLDNLKLYNEDLTEALKD